MIQIPELDLQVKVHSMLILSDQENLTVISHICVCVCVCVCNYETYKLLSLKNWKKSTIKMTKYFHSSTLS